MKHRPLTKKQVEQIQPEPFKPLVSWPRFKNGALPVNAKPYAFKRTWSFEGTHSVTLPDGSVVQRPGQYVVKMAR